MGSVFHQISAPELGLDDWQGSSSNLDPRIQVFQDVNSNKKTLKTYLSQIQINEVFRRGSWRI